MSCAAKCDTCGTEYRRIKDGLNSARCIQPGCLGTDHRSTRQRSDSRNDRGEATYHVPVSKFPPIPLPKP